jgi:hypothetical protein
VQLQDLHAEGAGLLELPGPMQQMGVAQRRFNLG